MSGETASPPPRAHRDLAFARPDGRRRRGSRREIDPASSAGCRGPRCAGGSNRRHRGEDNCEEAERCLHAYRSPLFIGAGRRLECMDAGNRNCAFRAKRTGCSQAESYIIEHHVVSPGRSERAPSCPRAVHNARQVATAAARGVSGSTLGWANSVLPPAWGRFALAGRFEQFDRVPVGIFDLHLVAGGT